MLRYLGCIVGLLAAAPGTALTATGTFTPTASNDTLNLSFGALDTGGLHGNVSDIQAGRYRVSFTLSRPAETLLALQLVTVFNEYDRNGNYVGGDEYPQYVFDAYAFTDAGFGYITVPNPYRAIGFDEGSIEYNFFGYASLDATFTDLGVPVSYTFSVDRIADVPEPATWALMLTGFAMTGLAIRRRHAFKTELRDSTSASC